MVGAAVHISNKDPRRGSHHFAEHLPDVKKQVWEVWLPLWGSGGSRRKDLYRPWESEHCKPLPKEILLGGGGEGRRGESRDSSEFP